MWGQVIILTAAIFDFNCSESLGRVKIYTKGGGPTVNNKERGGGRGVKIFSPPPPPTPTVHSNCNSVMAGRTNDRELLALARSNKTPALRAIDEGPKLFEDTIDKHACGGK